MQHRLSDVKNLCLLSEFLGAFESTSGTIMHWALLLCAVFPEEQAKLHAELQQHVVSPEVRLDAVGRLPRLKAFLAEVKRFAVVMPLLLPHRTIANCRLASYEVPEDTLLFFNVWSACKDPQEWEQPHQFKPDRFLTAAGDMNYRRLPSFLHFGAGDRKCPGQRLGTTANLLMLANLLRKCRVTAAPGSEIDLEPQVLFNLAPKPIPLRFEAIQAA